MSYSSEHSGLVGQVMEPFRRRGRAWPGLRMTPMIDVIFLLLTFFVLTAQFEHPEQALPLVFGEHSAMETRMPSALEMSILPSAEGCTVKLAEQEVLVITSERPEEGLAALAEQVRRTAAAADGVQMPIRLHCDDAVSWDLVTKIYDVLYGLGARDIAFIIKE